MKKIKDTMLAGLTTVALSASVLFTMQESAQAGDIYSIEPVWGNQTSYRTDTADCSNNPLTLGEQATFLFRLYNSGVQGGDPALRNITNSWQLVFRGIGSESLARDLGMPKIGVYVSGVLKYADIVSVGATAINGGMYAGNFSDVICRYVVEGGDIALPLTLANSDGVEIGAGDNSASYHFYDPYGWWSIEDKNGTPANLSFATSTPMPPVSIKPAAKQNYSLGSVDDSIYIKAVDFDDNYDTTATPTYWRRVYEGMTSTRTSQPSIVVPGGNSTNNVTVLYLWIENTNNVSLPDATLSYTGEIGGRTVSFPVQKVTLDRGQTNLSFRVQGVTPEQTADVYLAATPGYKLSTGILVTNFVKRTIYCEKAPDPFLSIVFDKDETEFTAVADTNFTKKVTMYVKLSKAFSEDFYVDLNPTVPSGSDVFEDKLIGLVTQEGSTAYTTQTRRILIPHDTTLVPFYVFPLGATLETGSIEGGITFTPSINAAEYPAAKSFFNGEANFVTSKLYLTDCAPIILSPENGKSYSGWVAQSEQSVSIKLKDNYRDLLTNSTYSITWSYGDGSSDELSLSPTNNLLNFTVKYPAKGDYASTVTVKDASGNEASIDLNVTVLAPKTISARLYNSTDQAAPNEGFTYAEGENPILKFELSQPHTAPLYAFLVPLNEASSNLVNSTAIENGVVIQPNSTLSTPVNFRVNFLDGGDDAADIEFGIMLRNDDRLDKGDLIDGVYSTETLYLSVTNIVPTVTTVEINGGSVPAGGVFESKVSSGVPTKFDAVIKEPSYVDVTNGVITCWTVRDGLEGHYVYKKFYVTNDTVNTSCTYTFSTGGERQLVTVKAQDKDMEAAGEWGPEFQFYVDVDQPPYVSILPSRADKHYAEDSKDGYLVTTLSTPASDDIDVELTVQRQGTDGNLEFLTNLVHFTAGNTYGVPQNIRFTNLDGTTDAGTAGFLVTAKVITTTSNAYDQAWCDYYKAGTEYIYVDNVDPIISKPAESAITNKVTLNSERVLTWSIKDIEEDLTNGLSVTWTSSAGVTTTFKGPEVATGVYTNTFIAEGPQMITLLVEDKDGGQATRTWYYVVNPTKQVVVNPYGPSGSTLTKYDAASGRGKGRIWSNGSYEVSGFRHTWFYDVNAAQATLHAYGYAASKISATGAAIAYFDDGTLRDANNSQRDIALTTAGNSWSTAVVSSNCYKYQSEFDNFFYCWVDMSQTACLDSAGVGVSGIPHPAASPLVDSAVTVTLDPYEEDKTSYEVRNIEAIFSRELYASDNMGDINADGIPDLYVKKYGFGAGENTEAGGGAGDGTATVDDLVNLDQYNEDADYLPGGGVATTTLIPGTAETWVAEGVPFTADLEIRGFGSGLNDAPQMVGLDSVPDRDFDEIEQMAYNELTADEKIGWSPESPSDPTLPDTDGDGFTDGYEYYYWYYAKVGYLNEEGKHVYLTGLRYNPADPSKGDVISAAEIIALFNPNHKKGAEVNAIKRVLQTRDSDNDGLTDLEEFYLGTNPILWDTDGDGLPDGYEVLIGLNPLVAATTPGFHDAYTNPDGDYMAYSIFDPQDRDPMFRIFGVMAADRNTKTGLLTDPHVHYVAVMNDAEVTTELSTESSFGCSVMVDGEVYFTELGDVPFDYNDDGEVIMCCELPENQTFLTRTDDNGTLIRSTPTFLPRGTILDEEPVLGAECFNEVLTMEWKDTDPQPNHAWHAWKYGKDVAETCSNCDGTGSVVDTTVVPAETIDCPTCHGAGMIYNGAAAWGNYMLGYDMNMTPGLVLLFEVRRPSVGIIHSYVYQWRSFDPRTAWGGGGSVNTRPFYTYDEFLTMSFFYNTGALKDKDVVAKSATDMLGKWATYTTNPLAGAVPNAADGAGADTDPTVTVATTWAGVQGADSDADGVPDGWELYVMAGPRDVAGRFVSAHPTTAAMSPLVPDSLNCSLPLTPGDEDGLDQKHEFDGLESTALYAEVCSTIKLDEGWTWYNKAWPTDPWNEDTDDDGIADDAEQNAFSYGTPRIAGLHNGAIEGGGLNPLSWDTDGDGLPDPWELQYAGTPTSIYNRLGGNNTNNTQTAGAAAQQQTAGEQTMEIVNGMDGTSADATTTLALNVLGQLEVIDRDYDHDGLYNWQEYVTGAMRAWRYDDPISPWGDMPAVDTSDPAAVDWGEVLLNRDNPAVYNPHLTVSFDPTAYYFSLQTNEWDQTAYGKQYFFCDGPYHELSKPSADYKVDKVQYNRWTYYASNTLGVPCGQSVGSGEIQYLRLPAQTMTVFPLEYFGCSPILADSDNDGMDDYFELFHGMNPILGEPGSEGDLIFMAYGGERSLGAAFNGEAAFRSSATGGVTYNFVFEPWLSGVPTADPDGDNIRNQEEAIMAQLQALSTWHHTDPTPLWMTDSSYAPGADIVADPGSLTARYYMPAAGVGSDLPGLTFTWNEKTYYFEDCLDIFAMSGETPILMPWKFAPCEIGVANSMYAYEENEGYDTDHDGLSDFDEASGKYRNASDPQGDDSPVRHQAMYFDGVNSFLESLPEVRETFDGGSEENVSGIEMRFLEYTVEAWVKADNPAAGEQTVVERAVYTAPAHQADSKYLRRNFSIGIDANGNWYACHDSRGTDALQTILATGPAATADWTHLAATYGAKAGENAKLTLYVNGVAVKTVQSNVQPENGTAAVTIDGEGAFAGMTEYATVAMLVGTAADAVNDPAGQGIWALSPLLMPEYTCFHNYFAGYIDEVRVWNGARTAVEIAANFKKRFTSEDARQNRQEFFTQWSQFGERTDAANQDLPAELRYMFGFDHTFGAADAAQVATSPAGFVYDGVDGKSLYSRPAGWVCPWWASLPCASTVYNDYAWVPWINNMAKHLDRFDGSTVDSVYWSKGYAGLVSAASLGLQSFSFKHTHEPYGYWTQVAYTDLDMTPSSSKYLALAAQGDETTGESSAMKEFEFARRNQLCAGGDLLPFGGAFAKYCDAMWDDGKSSSTWETTGVDSDNDGLPDWWEAEFGSVGWDDVVTYDGVEMSAGEAYQRSLAAGAHEGAATGDEAYAQTSDLDKDGIADWWEELYKIDDKGGDDDSDNDGLSNYSEYAISEAFKSLGVKLNPTKSRTDDVTLDYFRTVGYLYMGEMFTDHDMMEDEWEHSLGDLDYVSPWVWDATSDADEDGWSAFAECRYHYFKSSIVASLISHVLGNEEVKDFPQPTIRLTARYHGTQSLAGGQGQGAFGGGQGDDAAGATLAPLVVNTYTKVNPASPVGELVKSDAMFQVVPGSSVEGVVYLGSWEDRVVHVTMGPGYVNLDSLNIETARLPRSDSYSWTDAAGTPFMGTYEEFLSAYRADPVNTVLSYQAFEWDPGVEANLITVTTDATGRNGYICLRGERIGTIDLQTGDASIDLSPFKEYYATMVGNEGQPGGAWSMTDAVMRLTYTSKVPMMQQNKLTVSLSQPTKGYVKEGKTTLTAFYDLDGDGLYTPGEPFGTVNDVDVSWGTANCEIELTDTHPVFARVSLADAAAAANDRDALYGSESGNYTNVTAGTLSGGTFQRVRVIRTLVDGKTCEELGIDYEVVMDKWLDLNERNYLHEGDFFGPDSFDIDWAHLREDINASSKARGLVKPEEATYTVLLGNGAVDFSEAATNNLLGLAFTRKFDAAQVTPTLVSPIDGNTVYSANPTFVWSSGVANSYTAFRLQVGSGDGRSIIYDSGIRALPARDSNGNYKWTAPLYAFDQTPNGVVFTSPGNYTWRVTMYNSKFRTDNYSILQNFRMNTNADKDVGYYGYTKINVAVHYFGPADVINGYNTFSTLNNKIRVQAFASPDFTGLPAAETCVSSDPTTGAETVNAVLFGLPEGEWYVRAFVDTNGDFKCQPWESWGYACNREMTVAGYSRFSPVPVKIDSQTVEAPFCSVYIEDCDTDGDWFPDAYEMATRGNLNALGPVTSSDGLVNVNPTLANQITHELAASLCTLAGPDLDTLQDATMAALILGVDTKGTSARAAVASALNAAFVEPEGVVIKDISLLNGVVTVKSDAEVDVNLGGLSTARSIYTGEISGEVVYKVWYKKNLTDPEWTLLSTETKKISESGEVVSDIDISGTIDPESGFFKVTLE